MSQVFLLVILCSGAFFLSAKLNKKIEETLPYWIILIIIILYIFGLLGILVIGVYAILLLAALGLIYTVYTFIKNKSVINKNLFSPGLVVFIVLFFISWLAQRGRLLSSWDELSHWGLTVKNMYLFDAFPNHPASNVVFRDYPPAIALLQYLFVKLAGTFSEDYLYRAINILYFSLMLFLFKDLRWKDYKQIILRFILVLVLPIVFEPNFFVTIYVDMLLGILFAYSLINYYTNKYDSFHAIGISLSLFVLTLIKASGFGLAIIAVIIIALDMLIIKRRAYKYSIVTNPIKGITTLLLPLLLTLAANFSWSIYLNTTNTGKVWDYGSISLDSIVRVIFGNRADYQTKTINNFFNNLFTRPITENILNLSFIAWIVLLVFLSSLLIKAILKKEEAKRFSLATSSLFIGAALYCIILLFLYLFTFSEYEAERTASITRYLHTYLIGLFVFFVSIIVIKEHKHTQKRKIPITSLICFVLLLFTSLSPILNITILAKSNISSTIKTRNQYNSIQKIEQVVSPNEYVYFISAGDDGFDYCVTRYIIAPQKLNVGRESWSLGEPYFDGDIWSEDIGMNEWEEILVKKYSYVYVFRTNDYFNEHYGDLFEGGVACNDTLYHVEASLSPLLTKIDLK